MLFAHLLLLLEGDILGAEILLRLFGLLQRFDFAT
jgi:hypothetical protein